MNVEDFYKYITQHMTPEEALRKLLQSSLIQYEHLKFDEKMQPVHPVLIIAMASLDLGWQLCIKKDEEEINGITVGTEEYIKLMMGDLKKE